MLKYSVCAMLVASAAVPICSSAEDKPTPGVVDVAPGVREVDGSKVPSQGIDVGALKAMLDAKKPYADVRDFLGGDGIATVGPAGSTVHLYKVHDTVTAANEIVILFVKDDAVVDHLVQEVGARKQQQPQPSPAP
jgi:hypothetical protein